MRKVATIVLGVLLLLPISVAASEHEGDYYVAQERVQQYFVDRDAIAPDDTEAIQKYIILTQEVLDDWDKMDVTYCWAEYWYVNRILLSTTIDFLSYAPGNDAKGAGALAAFNGVLNMPITLPTCEQPEPVLTPSGE